jgi:hypothetical protein
MCAAPTNILTWNPNQLNQQTDGQYAIELMRTDGAVSGIYPSVIANKLFYQCSVMAAALAQAMVNKGYEMQDAVLADLVTSLSNILTKAEFGAGANTVCQGNDDRLNEPGTKMWFYQNVAPTGWTIDATAADAVLAVKGGSNAYYVAGGTQSGTWTQPSHYHSGGSHTHTFTGVDHLHSTAGHVLTAGEMPYHNHNTAYSVYNNSANSSLGAGASSMTLSVIPTTYAGGNQAHDHGATGAADRSLAGATGASGTGATGNGATAATWRPLANVGIICTKN